MVLYFNYFDFQQVRFGIVDCTVETELASRFGVTGYPAVKVFTML